MKRIIAIYLVAAFVFLAGVVGFAYYAQGETLPYAGGYTVQVRIGNATGSGFHIGDGYIVTANHVVDTGDTGKIYTDMGGFREFTVMWRNEDLDIALLLVNEPINIDVVEFDCAPPSRQHVVMHGLPGGLDFLEISGFIGSHTFNDVKAQGAPVVWKVLVLISSKARPGMSGGPVVDEDGEVVGVIVGGGDADSVAVPAEEVCKLLP